VKTASLLALICALPLGRAFCADGLALQGGGAIFRLDAEQGGRIASVAIEKGPPLTVAADQITSAWEIGLGLGDTPDETWTTAAAGPATVDRDGDRVRMMASARGLRLEQSYALVPGSAGLVMEAWLSNSRTESVIVGRAQFTLGPVAIGGRVDHNEYLYPPQVFQQMRGPLSEATPGFMNNQYIYGAIQPTDKLSLPMVAIWDEPSGVALGLGCRNDEAVVRVGVIGGEAGQLETNVAIYRTLQPGEKLLLGRILIGLYRRPPTAEKADSWAAAMASLKLMCVAGGVVEPPHKAPAFLKDLQIAWIGPYCAPYNTFDDIRAKLPAMAAGGINALLVGGRLWYCRNSARPELGDFLPILRGGKYSVDDTVSGGEAGLRRLLDEGHRLGMKVFCWGPTLAGIALESPEVQSKPEWWIRKADGSLNLWYQELAPPDATVEGWRQFVLSTVRQIAEEQRFDGCWLDSTWKDHALNFKSASGWYGGPNGAKLSLIRDVRRMVKSLNPNFVLMAESGGAETGSAVDVCYVRALGVFPLVPPERMQETVRTEEACRLDGERPFGQFQVDPGPLGDEHPVRKRLLVRDSWKATLFLVNTLPRVPGYFVGDPIAKLVDHPELGEVARRLMAVRRSRPEMVDGKVVFEGVQSSAPQVVRFCRVLGRRASLVLVNCGAEPATARITLSGETARQFGRGWQPKDLLGQAVVTKVAGSDAIDVTLPAYRGAILPTEDSR
jgi:hypothetical protein